MLSFKMSEVQTEGILVIKAEEIWKWLKIKDTLYKIWEISNRQKYDQIQ